MAEENKTDVLAPEAVQLPDAPSKVTEEEALVACKVLGLKPIRVRRLAKSAIIGRFMEQLGATRVGAGRLMMVDQQIEKGLKLCDRFMGDYPHEPEVIASLMRVRAALTEAMLKSAHTMIKVNKDSGAVDLEMKPLVQAFPANAPINVNTQVNLVAPTENKS